MKIYFHFVNEPPPPEDNPGSDCIRSLNYPQLRKKRKRERERKKQLNSRLRNSKSLLHTLSSPSPSLAAAITTSRAADRYNGGKKEAHSSSAALNFHVGNLDRVYIIHIQEKERRVRSDCGSYARTALLLSRAPPPPRRVSLSFALYFIYIYTRRV